MDANGYGKCEKEDTSFDGKFSCYVNTPSTCSDLLHSDLDPELSVGAEACAYENRGRELLYFLTYIPI